MRKRKNNKDQITKGFEVNKKSRSETEGRQKTNETTELSEDELVFLVTSVSLHIFLFVSLSPFAVVGFYSHSPSALLRGLL